MRNIFDEEESPSGYDLIANQQQQVVSQQPQRQQPQQQTQQYEPEYEDIEEQTDVAYDLVDSEEDIVEEAMVRLEQARLYEMLIKHDIFEGVKANKIAMANVQKEIKDHIISRLQILLGIRTDVNAERYSERSLKVELPFNKMEIQALKDIANKLTKGASSEIQEKETVNATEEEVVKPQKLKSLGSKTKQEPVYEEPVRQKAAPPAQKPAQRQVQKPVQRQVENVTVSKEKKRKALPPQYEKVSLDNIVGPDGVRLTKEEIEEAKRSLAQDLARGKSKPIDQMSEQELIERAQQMRTGQAVSKSIPRLAMPTQEQINSMVEMKQATQKVDTALGSILQKVLQTK